MTVSFAQGFLHLCFFFFRLARLLNSMYDLRAGVCQRVIGLYKHERVSPVERFVRRRRNEKKDVTQLLHVVEVYMYSNLFSLYFAVDKE